VIISGRPAQDPELKEAKRTGKLFTTFTLAHETYKGDQTPKTVEYFDVVAFDRVGQNAYSMLRKGKSCTVQGRLSENKWDSADGRKVKSVTIVATYIEVHDRTKADKSLERNGIITAGTDIESPREIQAAIKKAIGEFDEDMPDYSR
jgi:single-strand DNA-binding protein